MEQSAHFLTVATPDLDAARQFYCHGLGWTPLLDVPGEILFFQISPGFTLGLFDAAGFNADILEPGTQPAPSGLTLSHNVDSPAKVDGVVASAVSAGATLVKAPQKAAFGGYHGHFADPNGVLWEVCHNPGWHVDADGRVHLGPVDEG
jgi:catechol 2,3-dioxygenase-like lactoylglutathione lyase family enzyme